MELTHFSTFTGIAGFDLAAEWAGFRTIGMVEKNPYRQKVLRKYWSNVPLWEDIRDVTEESLKEKGIITFLDNTASPGYMEQPWKVTPEQGSNRQENGLSLKTSQDAKGKARGREIPPVTLITGGFPCQSFSVAGKRRGKADDRYLWPEMLRVIKLLRPHWVLAENVTGIIRMALDTVLSDLESEGYSVQAFVIPACSQNAPHRRDRVWVVANALNDRGGTPKCTDNRNRQKDNKGREGWSKSGIGRCSSDAPDPHRQGFPDEEGGKDNARASRFGTPGFPGWWESEPDVGRVADGVPSRVDRLAALGDAIVPQVAYQILRAIAQIERSR